MSWWRHVSTGARWTPAPPFCGLRALRRITVDPRAFGAGALLVLGLQPAAAAAEFGYSVTLASDDRFRGASTSDGRPVATLDLSYDDAGGFYAGASATVGPVRDEGLRVLRSVQYAGYAHRLSPVVSLDLGISNRLYDRHATVEYARRFAQLYGGLVGRRVSAHVFFAPDYDKWGNAASYAQVDALLLERDRLSLTGHLGALRPPRVQRYGRTLEYDWRFGATRRFGLRSSVTLAWVGGGPVVERNGDRHWRGTLMLSATHGF